MSNDKPLVEEYFVCTVRPDSCHAVMRYNEDGETKQMIHFANKEEAREFARDMAIKFCTEAYQKKDPVRCFLAKHTRTGGGLPYLNEDIGRFGKDGVEIFPEQISADAPESKAEVSPINQQLSFLGM